MKRITRLVLSLVLPLAACDEKPDTIFFEEPSRDRLEGVWAGIEEITTDGDVAWNSTYSTYGGGFSFAVVLTLDEDGFFSLTTSNFSTSFERASDRTCAGVFTHASGSLQFFPNEACRALPLRRFTIGRILDDGIALEARQLDSFASIRVRFRLERE